LKAFIRFDDVYNEINFGICDLSTTIDSWVVKLLIPINPYYEFHFIKNEPNLHLNNACVDNTSLQQRLVQGYGFVVRLKEKNKSNLFVFHKRQIRSLHQLVWRRDSKLGIRKNQLKGSCHILK